ncbi:MAG: TIM barrel protein [Balneolales bacterium]|nr:TIM barrel protein [Balneolales bacterium]
MNRKKALRCIAAAGLGAGLVPTAGLGQNSSTKSIQLKGNINHAVCHWPFHQIPFAAFCREAVQLGIKAIDLCGPAQWPTLKEHSLHSSMCNGAEISLEKGWCNSSYHNRLIENYSSMIPKVAEAGYTNLICFSGNRDRIDDETGLKNSVIGLKQILPLAEQYNVVIQMELFNSKVDHPGYMADTSNWGIRLCEELDSPNFKLLYDIYHMQISEGDIIRTIKENHKWFGAYHTAGVPGRRNLDQTQELYYPAIMQAIADTGFSGFVAHEFIPRDNSSHSSMINALEEAIRICDV